MHIRRGAYIGVAPLPGGLTNVSVVLDGRGPARPDATRRAEQQTIVRRAVSADAVLRDRFAVATQVSPVTVLGPLAVNARAAGCPGLLLAGDAAGFVDPMTGDGLRFALRGGELAAHAALDELASGRPAFARLARAAPARVLDEVADQSRAARDGRIAAAPSGSPRWCPLVVRRRSSI